jgi:hypothetical protein
MRITRDGLCRDSRPKVLVALITGRLEFFRVFNTFGVSNYLALPQIGLGCHQSSRGRVAHCFDKFMSGKFTILGMWRKAMSQIKKLQQKSIGMRIWSKKSNQRAS